MSRLEERYAEYVRRMREEHPEISPSAIDIDSEKDPGKMPWLPLICQSVHMATTGSGDCIPDQHHAQICYLKAALATWDKSEPRTAIYDNVVRALIEATLRENE